jgi:hypothetical protein
VITGGFQVLARIMLDITNPLNDDLSPQRGMAIGSLDVRQTGFNISK